MGTGWAICEMSSSGRAPARRTVTRLQDGTILPVQPWQESRHVPRVSIGEGGISSLTNYKRTPPYKSVCRFTIVTVRRPEAV